MSVAGPAEDLFLAARALSLAERMMLRWPHVEGVMSRMRVRRLGEEELLDAMVVFMMMMCVMSLHHRADLFDSDSCRSVINDENLHQKEQLSRHAECIVNRCFD